MAPAKFKVILGTSQWVQLPESIRRKLVQLFNLKRSGGAEVFNGRLITDGYTFRDLEGISIEKMQELLKSEETEYFKLFDKVLEHVENEVSGNFKKQMEVTAAKAEETQRLAAKTAMETIAAISEAVKPIVKKAKV